jgi:hypothetical protein
VGVDVSARCCNCNGQLAPVTVPLAKFGDFTAECQGQRCLDCGEVWTKPGDVVSALASAEAAALNAYQYGVFDRLAKHLHPTP